VVLFLVAAFGASPAPAAPAAGGPKPAGAAAAANVLSKAEKAAGWKLLFDGSTTKGWRGFKSDKFPDKGWVVRDGTITHEKGVKAGDIVTEEPFDNFELRFDFRLTEGGNSGVKYLVDESLVKQGSSGVSFEFQILDDARHPDAKQGKSGNRTCGALYDLIAPKTNALRPIGEWNEARLLVDGNHIEHWLNGQKLLEFERGGEALKALIAESKFKNTARFGEISKGHILLQDHHDEIAFRNVKIRKLPQKSAAKAR
jgi:hypothetical protein